MNLDLFIYPSRELFEVLQGDPRIASKLHSSMAAPFFVESDSQQWNIVCDASQNNKLTFKVKQVIPRLESTARFSWYAPQIRRTVPLTMGEFNLWRQSMENIPLVPVGNGYGIKRVKSLVVRKTPKKTCDFYGPDSGPYVFLCDRSMREQLESAGIIGLEYRPLFRKLGECHQDHFLLFSEKQLPLSPYHFCKERSIVNGAVELNGVIALVYEPQILKQLQTDVAMTAEYWCNETSQLLVTSKFVEVAKRAKAKGLEFYPVFEYATHEYFDLASSIERVLNMTTRNQSNQTPCGVRPYI